MKKTGYLAGFICLSLLFGGAAALLGGAGFLFGKQDDIIDADARQDRVMIVIDPGHGGEDGGCSAENGTLEKDLNLKISESVCSILNAAGYPAVLTRTEDTMLYDLYGDREDYSGYKKIYDLKNRLKFTEESGAECFVSIHMNKFTDPQYSGLQVYYSGNDGRSLQMADLIQTYAAQYVQPENKRQTKKSTTGIYLLNRLEIPSVLVECGFLSNTEETLQLTDEAYQKKLSLTISCAIMEYCAKNSGDENPQSN